MEGGSHWPLLILARDLIWSVGKIEARITSFVSRHENADRIGGREKRRTILIGPSRFSMLKWFVLRSFFSPAVIAKCALENYDVYSIPMQSELYFQPRRKWNICAITQYAIKRYQGLWIVYTIYVLLLDMNMASASLQTLLRPGKKGIWG